MPIPNPVFGSNHSDGSGTHTRAIGAGSSLTPAIRRKYGLGPKRKPEPSFKTMERWSAAGIAQATDGCKVEPDGTCPHGARSWLLVKGLI